MADPKTERAIRVMENLVRLRLVNKKGYTFLELRTREWTEKIREIAIDCLKNGKDAALKYDDE